ncbi:hypothetical protein [Frondihabitans cladoniiphilus]|uniref:Uncharacterized protein n=1 Tax=Frondihabitans cladoniiphilus TaxID=715785 RepID=A0ABP8WEW0_9MICO
MNDFGFSVPHRTATLQGDSKVITRQQLRDPAFYALVKDGVLNGTIQVLDGRSDVLDVHGVPFNLSDEDGRQQLAKSQRAWVGVDEDPIARSLTKEG